MERYVEYYPFRAIALYHIYATRWLQTIYIILR